MILFNNMSIELILASDSKISDSKILFKYLAI